jgi:thioredoxin-like negative regulator of GroEL
MIQVDSVVFLQPSNAEARFVKAQILAWSKPYRKSADILLALLGEDPNSSDIRCRAILPSCFHLV